MVYSATFDPAHLCSQICSPKLVRVAPESPGKDNWLWELGIASSYGLNHRGMVLTQVLEAIDLNTFPTDPLSQDIEKLKIQLI